MPDDSLEAWLTHLGTKPYADRSLKSCQVSTMVDRLKLLPLNTKIISVTGTNGKGSAVALLESIYTQAGYRVGAFTSPHLFSFNERIRICQQAAAEETIRDVFMEIEKARADCEIGYFQFSFLAALILFKRAHLDLILLEAGIGGLYDAVNAVDANLSIITQIGLDHCEILGHSRDLIAEQKAGLMRINRPTVCGDEDPPPCLFQIAKRVNADLFCTGRDFQFHEEEQGWSWHCDNVYLKQLPKPNLLLQNSATVLMAVYLLQRVLPVSEEALKRGIQSTRLLGRQQVVQYENKTLLFDVAHNADAIALLADKIKSMTVIGKKRIVFGVRQDKEYQNMVRLLSHVIDSWYLAPLNHPRTASTAEIRSALFALNINRISEHSSVIEAFQEALCQTNNEDLLIICGSFLTVASTLSKISGSIIKF